jgi:TP901 family phage tail tape measure protein
MVFDPSNQEQRMKVVYDASGAVEEIRRLDDILKQQGVTLGAVTQATTSFDHALDATVTKIKGLTVEGQKFEVLISKLEGELDKLKTTLNAASTAGEASADAFREEAEEVERSMRRHRDREAVVRKEIETQARLRAEIAKTEQAQFRAFSGNLIGSQLAGQANASGNRINATPAELNAVSNAVAGINRALADGTITARDYQTAVRAVASGTIQNLTPAQQRAVNLVHQYREAVDRMGRSNASKYSRETNEIQRITISWQGMIRLIEVQLLHSLVSNAVNAFQQAREEAKQFSIAIAEIETLSQRASLTTKDWTDGVLRLSDAFGKTPAEVAAGTYETISNQVAEGAEAFEHMTNILNLASVTMASAAEAGNLLDSIINSYGLAASQSAKISAELFKAVDLGRFKVEDLANTFGHTAVLGRNLNISYQELLASLSALTIQGISAEESQTLLSNVLIALIKPSKQMNELLKEWGVSSGEAAIQTFGFFEVLRKFEAAAQSGGDRFAEIGQIFQNIRAIRGFEGLSNAIDQAERNLKEITSSANEYNKAIEIINNSSGKRLQIEQQRISNAFLQVGESFNQTLLDASEYFGGLSVGVNAFITNGEQLLKILPLLTAGILGVSAATGTLTRALTFAGVFTPFGALSLALTGAAIAYTLFTESAEEANLRLQRSIDEVGEEFDKMHKDIKRAREEVFIKQSEEIEKSLQGSFRIFLRFAAEQNKLGNQLSDNITAALKNNLKTLDTVFDLIDDKGNAVRDNLRETAREAENEARKAERSAQNAQREIDRLRDKIADRNKSFDDKIFDQSLDGLSNAGKDEALEERAVQLINEAREARQLKNFDLANQKYEDANKILEKQRDIRQKINEEIKKEQDKILEKGRDAFFDKKKSAEDIIAIQKAAEVQEKRLKIAELETRIERLQEQRSNTRPGSSRDKQLVGSIEAAQAQIAKLDALGTARQKLVETDGFQRNLLAELNAFDQERIGHQQELLKLAQQQAAQRKAEAEAQEQALKNQEKAFDRLKDLLNQADDKDLKFADFAKINAQIQQSLGTSGLDREAQLTLARELNNRQRLLQAQVEVEKTQDRARAAEEQIERQKKFSESVKETNLRIKELTDESLKSQKEFLKNLEAVDSFLDQVASQNRGRGEHSSLIEANRKTVEEFRRLKDRLEQAAKIGDNENFIEDLAKLTQFIRSRNLKHPNTAANAGVEDVNELVNSLFEEARALSSSTQEINKQNALLRQQSTQLGNINAEAEKLKAKHPELAASAEANLPKIELQWSNINVQLTEQLRLLGQVAQIYSFLAGQVPGAGQQPAGKALGGPVSYYALGGFPGMPRGGDTIPIWAQAGESIINAKSSRAYAPLIRAINQTRTQHLSSGGEVTNIGDISINLPNVQKASEVDARDIVNRIKREARRGNIRF